MSQDSSKPTSVAGEKTGEQPDSKQKEEVADGFINYLKIFRYATPLTWTMYGISLFCAIACGAASPLMTVVFGSFTTKFSDFSTGKIPPEEFKEEINSFVLWFVWIFIARFILTYLGSVLVTMASIRMTRVLRQAFLMSVLRKEIWYFDVRESGSIATQVTTNGNKISQGTADKLLTFFTAISTFISAFVVALTVQWKLALITFTCVPVILVITAVAMGIDTKIESKVLQILSSGAVIAQESISSISTVQAFWAQGKMVKKYEEYLRLAFRQGGKKSPVLGVEFATEYFCSYAAIALSFWQGHRMYQSGEVGSIGTIFTVVFSTLIGATSISMLVPQLQALTNAASAASELFSVIDRKSQLDPLDESGLSPSVCEGALEARNLCFAYPARPSSRIIHNISLSIPPGKTTALVGPSGCGKSTLVGLLERWYNHDSGQLLLDGREICSYNTKWLRSRIRLVQQEPILFIGTVYENVARGFRDEQRLFSTEEQFRLVQAACEASNAHDFVCKLPEGYNTQLGESAGMLSGGQRQRLAIARSIISDPEILLLDEATSALDPRAENIVRDALKRVSKGRTVLTIAHKLATIQDADNIVVIGAGQVVEQGTHQQLLENNGHYAALVRAQDLGGDQNGPATMQDDSKTESEGPNESEIALTKTRSIARSVVEDAESQINSRRSVDYGLLHCIFTILKEQKTLYRCFAISTVGVLIGGATYPGQALLFARLISVFGAQGDEASSKANFYSLMFFVVAIGNLIAYFLVGWTCNVIGQTIAYSYRSEIFRTILNQDKEFFDHVDNLSGSLVSRIGMLPSQLQELISANVLLILIVIVNLVSSCALALAYGWKLALVVIGGGLPPLLASAYIRTRLEQKLGAQVEKRFFESASLATEAVMAIKTVASLTQEAEIFKTYSHLLANIANMTVLSTLHTMFWAALAQSLEFLMMALGFWYGGHLLANGEYTAQQFFIIFLAVLFSGQAAAQFTSFSTSLSKAADAANYIFWIRTLKPSITETDENRDIGPSNDNKKFDLQNLQFRYKQRMSSRVLRGVSMAIEPGQSIAFVGASGCGKSTMISLLERLYDPTTGRIRVGGTDISNMSPRLYRQQMSLVMQQPFLFRGSIRDNIALSLEHEPTDGEIQQACQQANALTFIQSLPEGLNTPCGSQGLQFSGGQRQRIAIARALIRKPRLLLLDEATSALDTQSERVVQATLEEAAATRTMISVAHRLSTVRNADCIYVFADGKVSEAGTHQQLLNKKGLYYGMCLTQALDQADT